LSAQQEDRTKAVFPGSQSQFTLHTAKCHEGADSIDPDVVKAKWESLDTIETLYGKGIISGDQTYGIKNHAVAYPWPYEIMMDGKVSSSGWIDDVSAIP